LDERHILKFLEIFINNISIKKSSGERTLFSCEISLNFNIAFSGAYQMVVILELIQSRRALFYHARIELVVSYVLAAQYRSNRASLTEEEEIFTLN